jgi:hypothetical protein
MQIKYNILEVHLLILFITPLVFFNVYLMTESGHRQP